MFEGRTNRVGVISAGQYRAKFSAETGVRQRGQVDINTTERRGFKWFIAKKGLSKEKHTPGSPNPIHPGHRGEKESYIGDEVLLQMSGGDSEEGKPRGSAEEINSTHVWKSPSRPRTRGGGLRLTMRGSTKDAA